MTFFSGCNCNKILVNCLSLIILFAGLTASDAMAWGIRVDVNSIGNKIELKPATDPVNENLKNYSWGDELSRKCNLFFQKKELAEGKSVDVEFTFIPMQSGKVSIKLNGCWAKRQGMAQKDQLWVEYIKVEAEGAKINNDDFSERDSNGKLKFWNCEAGAMPIEKGVKAWNGAGVLQTITVTAMQPVKIRLSVRDGGALMAIQPSPPISFAHENWELLVDGSSGVWKDLKWKGESVASNPHGFPMFQLHGQDTYGERKLTGSSYDQKTGVVKLITSNGFWTFEERIHFGKHLKRELFATFNGHEPAKFKSCNFLLYFPKVGNYYFPRSLFGDTRHYSKIGDDPFDNSSSRSGKFAEMKNGESVNGVSDCYFSFLQPSSNRTLMFAFDGRREPVRESFRCINDCIESEINIRTAGWAMPGVSQQIGPCYINVFEGDVQQALRNAPHQWYRDIGMLPPVDRPGWVEDITSLWVFCPSPYYGGVDGAFGAINHTIPYAKKRGANTFWILPLYNGFYGVIDYYGIRPDVGAKEDYTKLVSEAKANGFHVWQDLVPHGGKPEYGMARGVSPFAVSIAENGQFVGRECFDYTSSEWREYICNVASYYMKKFAIDGFRIDQCGFSPVNWRRPGFPAVAPKNADARWWNEAVAKNGGQVPAVEGTRGSFSLREGGRILTKEIRDVVRKYKNDGAVLAETETLSSVPSSDSIFDFYIRRVGLKMPIFDGETTALELSRYFDEQKFTDPPGTLRIRFLEVHDAQRQRFTNWCGENAGHALRSAIFWSRGIPQILSNTETGIGVLLRRLNEIRSGLPEFCRGKAEYQVVKSKPAVFAVLRELPEKSSVGITSFQPKPVETTLDIPVEQLGFMPGRDVVLFNSWTGEKLREGKLESFKKIKLKLPAYGNAVLTWRKAGIANPVLPPEQLDYSVSAITDLSLKDNSDEIRVEGARPLVIDKRTGLIKRFGTWLDGSTILSDHVLANTPAEISAKIEEGKAIITAKLAMGASICYRLNGDELEIEATLNKFSPSERNAFVLAATNSRRWQVNSIEGKLDDFIDKNLIDPNFRAFLPQASATYRPAWSAILWHSEMKPLDPSSPKIKAFGNDGKGFEIVLDAPLSTSYDDAMLMNKLPGHSGLHAAFFWVQPGPLSLAKDKETRSFKIMIRPARQDFPTQSFTVAGVKIAHESLFWRFDNTKYKLRLTRNGGTINTMTDKSGTEIISNQDMIAGKTTGKPTARASLDLETGVRCYTEDQKLKFRFISALRNSGNHGIINPLIWNIIDYSMDSSDTLQQQWYVYADSLPSYLHYYEKDFFKPRHISYIAQSAGKNIEIPVCKTLDKFQSRTYYGFGADISTNKGFKEIAPANFTSGKLDWNRFFQIYSLADKKQLPLMIASCFPGNSIVGWIQDTNARFVQGYRAPAAIEIRRPGWANVGPLLDLSPGKYKMNTWIKGKDIICKGVGRAWIEMRLIWTENDKQIRRVKRFDLPQGSFDWQQLSTVFDIPENISLPVKVVLAPVLDGDGSGTILADLPELFSAE